MNNQILALSRRLQHPVRLCLAALLCATAAPLLRAQTTNEFTSSTIIVATNTAYDGENIVIDGCTLTVDGTHTFNSISLSNGAVLTHQPATAVQTFSLVLTVTNNVFVDSTSSINVSGCGYLPGYTLDDSTNGAANNTAGGSYGGLGGLCCGSTSDAVYGDFHYPNELGSGS
ncbi:MAG TPA: hypothetical protein VMR33_02225, partial [Candidatus Baltobacteraceae bacterium]|nr:hypothetical protein [Candidatus Baltobacteraceae bacterium]